MTGLADIVKILLGLDGDGICPSDFPQIYDDYAPRLLNNGRDVVGPEDEENVKENITRLFRICSMTICETEYGPQFYRALAILATTEFGVADQWNTQNTLACFVRFMVMARAKYRTQRDRSGLEPGLLVAELDRFILLHGLQGRKDDIAFEDLGGRGGRVQDSLQQDVGGDQQD